MVNAGRSETSDDSAKGSSTLAFLCEYFLKLELLCLLLSRMLSLVYYDFRGFEGTCVGPVAQSL
jgi:hypothetical protein